MPDSPSSSADSSTVASPTYAASCDVFLRLLGLAYVFAVVSLWVQIDGLIGSRGILPAEVFLERVAAQIDGFEKWRLVPTLFHFGASDAALHGACAAAVLLGVAVVLGVLRVPALIGLWLIYLSLSVVGQVFLGFQWDALLLETGLVAIFLFAPRLKARRGDEPSVLARLLLWWLLFRLMWSSGVVKLSSGDETWSGLTAMTFHYETQPLPTWTAWLAHQLPEWFHRATVLGMFAIELAIPFLIFIPRRLPRRIACALLVALQLGIAATGNYGYFNFLSAALCIPLLDDRLFPTAWRQREESRGWKWPWAWANAPLALVVLLLSPMILADAFRKPVEWPEALTELRRDVAPLRSINGYGLFAVMTTERPEIEIEGSDDGVSWTPYVFRWKPGALDSRPAFIGPHMPRLDWQMWFAALGDVQRNPWLVLFMARLAEGSPPVLDLLEENPFPDEPPRYLRARFWDYRFSDSVEREETGTWWVREELGMYVRAMESEQFLRYLPP